MKHHFRTFWVHAKGFVRWRLLLIVVAMLLSAPTPHRITAQELP